MMRRCVKILSFMLLLFLQEITSKNVRDILNASSEYYLFKPILSGYAALINEDGIFSTRLIEGNHIPEVEFSFLANGTKYHIFLTLNEDLFPRGFSVSYLGKEGEPETRYTEESIEDINNCYYHGHVIGIENSRVIASTCHGLDGTIYLPGDVLHFTPVGDKTFMHVLYREKKSEEQSCGTDHHDSFHHTMTASEAVLAPTRLKRAATEQKYIELLFVVNKELNDKFKDRVELHEHVKSVANYVDGLYKLLKLRVVLLHLEVWEKEDKIKAETDAQKVLGLFLAYRTKKVQESENPDSPWKYTDNAQLLYGGSFDGTTVGMATVSSMCGLRSGGVNEDRKDAQRTSSTIAHELGHNMGMSHDTRDCSCVGKKCVMAPTAGATPPDNWTDCSIDHLNRGYKFGTATCLLNTPDSSKLFGGPKCGNGIVETGEQCDCGLPEECDSKCCNATTCKLHAEAFCDSGTCCTDDCKFKDSCHVCRTSENDCDITEYCTGYSAHCPGNIHKLDGMDCNSGSGMCYGGICKTHEMQCKEIWGPDAINGRETCYSGINVNGDWNGNCGKDGPRFKPCAKENVLCGKLFCMHGENRPLTMKDRISFRTTVSTKGEVYVCKSIRSINGTSDSGDLAAVWDGTKCGDGKICFDGACRNASSVLKPCNKNCNGHGICNNFGNCHCEAGWGPPDCKNRGDGGSVDSGPICASNVDMQVILLVVFFVVIFPAILIIITVVWWKVCGGRQKVYAWRKNRAYRRGQQNPKKREDMATRQDAPPTTSSQPVSYSSDNRPYKPSYPAVRPQINRPSAPAVRPPPPNRPSPRLPVRSAPKVPPSVPKRPQPSQSHVAYRNSPVSTFGNPRGPQPNSSNSSNQSSMQARIAQFQQRNEWA